jgi:hypothetical protein
MPNPNSPNTARYNRGRFTEQFGTQRYVHMLSLPRFRRHRDYPANLAVACCSSKTRSFASSASSRSASHRSPVERLHARRPTREQHRRDARAGIRRIVMRARRMVDPVTPGAAGLALQTTQLTEKNTVVGQLDDRSVDVAEQVEVELRAITVGNTVEDAVTAERLARPLARVAVADDEPGPGYWTGEASMPRSAQHENVAIHLYAPQYLEDGGLLRPLSRQQPFTHAFFPQDRFAEVVQEGNWTFGREGDGYVALWSWRPPRFVDYTGTGWATDGMGKPFDLVAEGGPDDVWIVECGRAAEWGSFDAFRAALAGSRIEVTPLGSHAPGTVSDGFSVRFDSPSQGLIRFGWKEPFSVGGKEIPLADPLRYDSPWARQAFDARRTLLLDAPSLTKGYGLFLDFEDGVRRPFGPASTLP